MVCENGEDTWFNISVGSYMNKSTILEQSIQWYTVKHIEKMLYVLGDDIFFLFCIVDLEWGKTKAFWHAGQHILVL